jgi:hypothetical protein
LKLGENSKIQKLLKTFESFQNKKIVKNSQNRTLAKAKGFETLLKAYQNL